MRVSFFGRWLIENSQPWLKTKIYPKIKEWGLDPRIIIDDLNTNPEQKISFNIQVPMTGVNTEEGGKNLTQWLDQLEQENVITRNNAGKKQHITIIKPEYFNNS